MSIEKRLERVEAILDARGLDWDHPRVEEKQLAEEPSLDGLPDIRTFAQPNLRWRILEPGEVVCSSDWVIAKSNLPSDPPSGLGWRPVDASVGTSVCEGDPCIFARLVADEPAKPAEPEYREPVLPADACKECQFSDDGIEWRSGWLNGWIQRSHQWVSHSGGHWRHCRIKVDA